MSTTRAMTEAELMALPRDGWKRELVDGEIVVSPAGAPHGSIIVEVTGQLRDHVKPRGLGHLFDSSTGCWMPSGNLRVPDVSFVSHERMPGGVAEGFLEVVPDLVVEVLSPGDSQRRILDKVGEYLAAGVRMVWVVDRIERIAVSYRSLTNVRVVHEDDDLDGEDVVPGFRCRLRDVFG
jgi:Uma2 family endonuclease